MSTTISPLAFAALFMGMLFFALGGPLAKDRVAPNMFYGFRTARTLKDRDAWYRANRVTGIWMQRWAVAILLAAGVLAFLSVQSGLWIFLAVTYGGAIAMVIAGFRAIRDTSLPGAPPLPGEEPPDSSELRKPPVR